MTTFGTNLRQEREARGIALAEIASATRIGLRYLEALEQDDLARLPGGAFNRGFVRAYAQFVGLDPDEVVEAYRQEEQAQGLGIPDSEAMIEELSRLVDRRPKQGAGRFLPASSIGRGLLLFCPLIVLLATAGWFVLGRGDASHAPATPVTSPAAGAALTLPEAASSKPADPGTRVDSVDGSLARPAEGSVGRESAPAAKNVPASTPSRATPSATTAAPTVSVPALPVEVAGSEELPTAGEGTRSSPLVHPPPARVSADPVMPASTVDAPRLNIPDFGVGTAVIDRQLVGESDHFREGSRVHFWTRAVDGKAGDRLHHVWIHDGRTVTTIELTIGGPHWRTHSRKTLSAGMTGPWTVEARDTSGRVLARDTFICVPTSTEPPVTVSFQQPLEKTPGE